MYRPSDVRHRPRPSRSGSGLTSSVKLRDRKYAFRSLRFFSLVMSQGEEERE